MSEAPHWLLSKSILLIGGLIVIALLSIILKWFNTSSAPNTMAPPNDDDQQSIAEWIKESTYHGESIDELLALEGSRQNVSILFAIRNGLQQKLERQRLSREEEYVMAVVALDAQVNNGGYWQFFINTPEWSLCIAPALTEIGCPVTAEITRRAISQLRIDDPLTVEKVKKAAAIGPMEGSEKHDTCNTDFFKANEPLLDRLFDWVKRNHDKIVLGNK